jgi:hypothetical protein
MTDSTTPRTRMTHGYCRSGPGQPGPSRTALRWFGVIGLADTSGYRLRPASPAQLGPVRPRAHAAAESII